MDADVGINNDLSSARSELAGAECLVWPCYSLTSRHLHKTWHFRMDDAVTLHLSAEAKGLSDISS